MMQEDEFEGYDYGDLPDDGETKCGYRIVRGTLQADGLTRIERIADDATTLWFCGQEGIDQICHLWQLGDGDFLGEIEDMEFEQ